MTIDARMLIPALKDRLDVPALMEQLFGETEMRGSMMFCPFHPHHRDTPSMHVIDEGERFRCYACPAGGDVIDFWRCAFQQKTKRVMSFRAAVLSLGAVAGLDTSGADSASTLLLMAQALRAGPRRKKDEVRIQLLEELDNRLNPLLLAVRYCGTSGCTGKADWLGERIDEILQSQVPYSAIASVGSGLERVARSFLKTAADVDDMEDDG